MDKNQEDALNMYQATDEVLTENSTVYATNDPFKEAVEELAENIETIENLRDQQDENTTGVTQDKENRRETLETLIPGRKHYCFLRFGNQQPHAA